MRVFYGDAGAGRLYDLCNMGGTGFNSLDEGRLLTRRGVAAQPLSRQQRPAGHGKFMRIAGARDDILAILNNKVGKIFASVLLFP